MNGCSDLVSIVECVPDVLYVEMLSQSFRSAPEHCANSYCACRRGGISLFSTTATTEQVSTSDHASASAPSLTLSVTDLGKVLAGIQVPPDESAQFDEFLNQLGYTYIEETDNEVYKRYLKG